MNKLLEKFPKNLLYDFPIELPGWFLEGLAKKFSLGSIPKGIPLEFIGGILDLPTSGSLEKKTKAGEYFGGILVRTIFGNLNYFLKKLWGGFCIPKRFLDGAL